MPTSLHTSICRASRLLNRAQLALFLRSRGGGHFNVNEVDKKTIASPQQSNMDSLFASLAILGLCLLVWAPGTTAQIPAACADASSLENLECCPVTGDGVCGVDANRGQCADLDLPHSLETSDVRRNWPHYYTRACQCNGNYGGYDCSRCRFGYSGSDCNTKRVLPRRPVASYTAQDWDDYNNVLRLTREYDSGYVVVLEESVPGNSSLVTADTTLYQLFVWLHHYTAKDSQDPDDPVDYSHTGPAFFTWHRLFSNWFEWEIQWMLQEMGIADYAAFRLPYWDWRVEIQNSTGITVDDLFTENRLGYTQEVNGRPVVTGSLFEDGWNTSCWLLLGTICDPRVNTGALQRCPLPESCTVSNPNWSTLQNIYDAMEFDIYDFPPYDITSPDGFRNFNDFKVGADLVECNANGLCFCAITQGECAIDTFPPITLTAQMHPIVHFLPGIGDDLSRRAEIGARIGTIEDVAASPNDPLFIVHHTMLDCILDEWLERHPDESYPNDPMIRQGHRRDDYVISFFPLYTNNEMFQRTDEYGYTCDLPNVDSQATVTVAFFTWSFLLLLSLTSVF